MDDSHKDLAQSSEIKNVLPDVVHSQQIPAVGTVVIDGRESGIDEAEAGEENQQSHDDSKTESISDHVSNFDPPSEADNASHEGLLRVDAEQDKASKNNSLNHAFPHSPASENISTQDPSKLSTSWPLDVNAESDVRLSEESPINLALSSDLSKEVTQDKSVSQSLSASEPNTPNESLKSGHYLDSLNEESNPLTQNLEEKSIRSDDASLNSESNKESSGSEEIIKLDIRGSAAPKFPFSTAKIIFGLPPDGSTVLNPNVETIPVFPNLLSPFLVGAGDNMKVEDVFNNFLQEENPEEKLSLEKDSLTDQIEQSDQLVEEIVVDEEMKEKDDESLPPKSIVLEDGSMSTLTTDYKTICEEYHVKLVHLEAAITERDKLIEDLQSHNEHLIHEVSTLQHMVGERSASDQDTVQGQLSDFMKYQSMLKDDSTKFYSALLSGGSSLHSSNGEKDIDREEITVNYSRSDLKSSEASDEFQTGFEVKLTSVINKFDEFIEENLRNKLRESLLSILCDEIGKMRIESDTEIKELERQIRLDKQAYSVETRRLRELLASVKAGDADIDLLREELASKHEKEMENLRTYFEKKCSDMERSYSEEVWRGKCASPTGSASSLDAAADAAAAGDYVRRRTRSAELPSLSLESTQLEQALKLLSKRYEQQIEELKMEHVAYVEDLQARQRAAAAPLELQITQLKALIQTNENPDGAEPLYQQDIDLELEKVLLSDPDAEVSSWPLELVALRDRIHGEKAQNEKEFSSLKDELCAGEDKWKQRRNICFDQNRHLEEITKERDDLKHVAVSLHRVVTQLAAYCACAEDELNRTVLAQLLQRLLPQADDTFALDESATGTPNQSSELDTSVVSRTKHVHFAPDLNAILSDLDEDGLVGFLQQQRDLSADIKRELESSLRRLRHEAHSLLDLSARLPLPNSKALESSQLQITELDRDDALAPCGHCEPHRKNMEEAMSECLQRENLLRSDLEAALIKIAELMTNADVIAEGYGTGGSVQAGGRARPRPPRSPPASPPRSPALESPRALLRDVDALRADNNDLQQQLEAANRQLRSTRQFVEEQAGEREAERDEFARQLADLRDENARLAARLQSNARILSEVEQLEAQTRDMNQIIADLETRKATSDDQLKATEEKISLLRDIIANLETQLEQKTVHEAEILEQLEEMKRTIEERDSKMRSLVGELETMRSERAEESDVTCVRYSQEEDKGVELMETIQEQCRWLEDSIHHRTRRLERVHETCSTSCSEPTEDVSLRDQRDPHLDASPQPASPGVSPRARLAALGGVWECLQAHARAEDAVLKRVADLEMQRAQLKDVAQEVRAERDVLQARMSEQALKISSLSARLQQQRNDAEALSHQATSQLSVELHDARAEVQRLKEELESKDKQLTRIKNTLDEREKLNEQHHSLYGNSCNPKDKVIILERELSSAQTRVAQLEGLVHALEVDREQMQVAAKEQRRELAEKENQLDELLALKLEDDQKDEKSEVVEGKASARTLSDIVSISEFDEQDLQMRRAELKANANLSGAPFPNDTRDKTLNRTMPLESLRHNMSSLNIEHHDLDMAAHSPRADSLPAHLTSTQLKEFMYKRNVNETMMFANLDKFGDSVKRSTAQNIPDNCSMYPNRDISDSKEVTVEPKKINFSLEATNDNRTNDEEFTSLRDLGITLDIRQENFPDIFTQLKHEIKKSRTELENCKSELKNAEEQLCEFPALKEEVEELKGLLENTMVTMENDKKFYENQLENFSSNKKLLEQRLTELTQEVNDKSKDLHLLKEDILRRENMILELAKEKRNLTNKMAELEMKINELQSRNDLLEKYESESMQMREKVSEFQKLEQLVSEKNQQIDSLNQHLDRLDDLQRCLNDKTEELDNLKEAFEEKSSEVYQLQDTIEALKIDTAKLHEENNKYNIENKDLKLKFTKLEKEQENASLKLQSNEAELERVNSMNSELTSKIDELKLLTDKLKDKETEIEILHEDMNAFHEEIASLKEQLKMASRSPSPRKSGDEKRPQEHRLLQDQKQLVKIRKQISLLQHELDFNKKELNDQAFELAKAKLDATELKNSLGQASKLAADREASAAAARSRAEGLQAEVDRLLEEKQQLGQQLEMVMARLREESNVSDLKQKLQQQSERCRELEAELQDLKDRINRRSSTPRRAELQTAAEERALAVRSPTAELERALRDQLHYSHSLDEDIMEQILSASSDEREEIAIPRLALNTSKSSSSIQSSSSERCARLRADSDKLRLQLGHLEARLQDKDALITELNRVRDKLTSDWQSSKLRADAARDNAARLQLLLDTHKETADSLQKQDSSMIQILKKRLESCMSREAALQQSETEARTRAQQLERRLLGVAPAAPAAPAHELEVIERLKGEISLLQSKLEVERSRLGDAQAALDHTRAHAQREMDAKGQLCAQLKTQLADLNRLKHDTSVELIRAKELITTQSGTIAELERRLMNVDRQRPVHDALTEMEEHKSELARELASLKQCVADSGRGELATLQARADEREHAVRYLHGRCLRLESCRKALVWQKRYLQRVLAGYAELERSLKLPESKAEKSKGKSRFKCVATVVVVVLRMGFLVRRRQQARALSANCILRAANNTQQTPSQWTPGAPHTPRTPRPRAPDSLARRAFRLDARLATPAEPPLAEFVRRSPYPAHHSPREEPFILSSPRGEVAAAYLNKLELVSRCLTHAMDTARDVP